MILQYRYHSTLRSGLTLLSSVFLAPVLSAQAQDFTYFHTAGPNAATNPWGGFVESAFVNEAPFDETHPQSIFKYRDEIADFNTNNTGQFQSPVGVLSANIGTGASGGGGLRGGQTMTSQAAFDLSAPGSTLTIYTRQHFFRPGFFSTNPRTGRQQHLYQLGLSSQTSHFGAAGNESLFVAYDYQDSFTRSANNSGSFLLDRYFGNLDVLDHNGYDAVIDNQWNHTPLATLATDVTATVQQSSQATAQHSIGLRYTHLGGGKMEVAMSLREILWQRSESSPDFSEQRFNTAVIVDHDFSDLSALRPAFGMALDTPFQGMGSGHNWDWDPNFAPDAPIPEPSALLLVSLGILPLLRRKRSA